jgi:hypothetical protein
MYHNGDGSFELGLISDISLIATDFPATGYRFNDDFVDFSVMREEILFFEGLNKTDLTSGS